jgi:capsular exopolysaccharide synthesis family protein
MSFLRRYALWIVLATVACTAGGWAFAAGQPVRFSTAAAVDVEANIVTGTVPVTPNLATEQQVATSGSVVSSAASALGESPGELHLSVTNKDGTNILLIACSEPTARAAVACANATAAAYRDYRNESGSSAAVRAHDPLHVTIVTSAPFPSAKSGKRKLELIALGVVLGLSLGIGTAFLRDRLDDRVRDRADLEHYLNAPVLSEIPDLRRRRSARPEAGVLRAPRSAQADAYRHLRARVSPLIASTDSQGKVLLVTSPQAGEGRTSVAINLAAIIALTGANVILVDADLRNRALSDEFQARDEPGLTDLLADQARIGDVVKSTDFAPGLKIVTAGTIADCPADLFDVTRLRRAFSQLKVLADVIIVDSGPLRAVSDPLALVPVSDIVMMVADVRRTRRASVTAAVQEITGTAPVAIVGVLNRVPHPWQRDPAPVKGIRPAAVTTAKEVDVRESESVTIAGNHDRSPRTWKRIGAPAGRAAAPRPTPGDQEPLPGDEGTATDSEDEPTMYIAAERSHNHDADAAAAAAPSNGVPSNGGSPNGVQAASGPPAAE